MKILSASDFHGDSLLAEKLAEDAVKNHADLVLLCGDLSHADVGAEAVLGAFKKRNLKVLFIPGNHDALATADFLAELHGIKNLHGYSVVYYDIGIFGCGGANTGPVNYLKESEILDLLGQGFEKIKSLNKKIMVTHAHPSDSITEKFSNFIPGSKAVRAAIDKFQPDLLLCGHVHEAAGLEEKIGKTRVINVGRQGTWIDI
ncbi:MAG TPA: metallophosphoesterase family protein [Candidatus Nanoarchaeia archaeon]|nr:metallophosphoesterase family protein [Candidatus Nanoarchaeia archaeon]